MPSDSYSFTTVADFVGQEIGSSDWVTVDQPMIDAFAKLTGDRQWIHIDMERAEREAPTGTTIAHGLLPLPLPPMMRREIGVIPTGTAPPPNTGTMDMLRAWPSERIRGAVVQPCHRRSPLRRSSMVASRRY